MTNLNYRSEVMRNCPNFGQESFEKKLDLGVLGVAGEAGEVADEVKKILHHDKPLDKEKLIKEMGDVHWYLEYLAATIGVTTEEVLRANVAKLRLRHPNGWSTESQNAKADEKQPDKLEDPKLTFEKELTELINKYSIENPSKTPDYILAKYVKNCLEVFSKTVMSRDIWYGRGSCEVLNPTDPRRHEHGR